MAALHDFTKEHATSSCNLLIGDKTLHVSSEILAMHSGFFRSLFFVPATKKDGEKASGDTTASTASANEDDDATPDLVRTALKDVRLDGVKVEEFTELLNIIYPSDSPVTEANVKYILELSDKYHFNVVMHECENFLKETNKLNNEERLVLADRYRLSELADEIIKNLKKEELAGLVKRNLSQRTTAALLLKASEQ